MIIDPQKNLLTTLLAGTIGALVLAGIVLFAVLGRVNVDRIAPIGDTSVAPLVVAVPDTGLEPFEEYNEILRRPVFFSDRRLPILQAADFEGEIMEIVEVPPDPEPVSELKASVAGIIITPEMRMAMIRDQEANRTVLLREGMSLEGEQAAWRLERIEPRLVSFVSEDGRSTGLELEVNTRGLTRPAAQRSRASDADRIEASVEEAEAIEVDDEARSRAEEIRRRVAERRAELRAEAERRAQQQQEKP